LRRHIAAGPIGRRRGHQRGCRCLQGRLFPLVRLDLGVQTLAGTEFLEEIVRLDRCRRGAIDRRWVELEWSAIAPWI
jgi:hypothetical protein